MKKMINMVAKHHILPSLLITCFLICLKLSGHFVLRNWWNVILTAQRASQRVNYFLLYNSACSASDLEKASFHPRVLISVLFCFFYFFICCFNSRETGEHFWNTCITCNISVQHWRESTNWSVQSQLSWHYFSMFRPISVVFRDRFLSWP